jgi:hypothetical protein
MQIICRLGGREAGGQEDGGSFPGARTQKEEKGSRGLSKRKKKEAFVQTSKEENLALIAAMPL